MLLAIVFNTTAASARAPALKTVHRPTAQQISKRMMEICKEEGLALNQATMEALVQVLGGRARGVVRGEEVEDYGAPGIWTLCYAESELPSPTARSASRSPMPTPAAPRPCRPPRATSAWCWASCR